MFFGVLQELGQDVSTNAVDCLRTIVQYGLSTIGYDLLLLLPLFMLQLLRSWGLLPVGGANCRQVRAPDCQIQWQLLYLCVQSISG